MTTANKLGRIRSFNALGLEQPVVCVTRSRAPLKL